MKIVGMITEYNPFHNGHQLHLKESLAQTESEAAICIMSGYFLQRGTPALISPQARTKMALQAGVDLVLQLPVSYSARSAEYFAYGAVKLLSATNIVDFLSFGSESGSLQPLKTIARLLAKEPPELSALLKEELKQGVSYPQARTKAVVKYLADRNSELDESQVKATLAQANNILGVEYIKALTRLNSSITPVTIPRVGPGYHSSQIEKIASGSAIRQQVKQQQVNNQPLLSNKIKTALPSFSRRILADAFQQGTGPTFYSDFTDQILTLLRRISAQELTNYEGVTGGLENRIKESARKAASAAEIIDLINTKRFAATRIQRILIHLLLNLRKKELTKFDNQSGPQYFRVLGFNQQGRKLIKLIKSNSHLPIITKLANHFHSSQQPRNLKQKMLSYDILASNLYALAHTNSQYRRGGADFKQFPILSDQDN